MAAAAEKKAAQVINAPLVQAQTKEGRVVYLSFGDIVPENLSADSLDNLKTLGFLRDAE